MSSTNGGNGKVRVRGSNRPALGLKHTLLTVTPDRNVNYALDLSNQGDAVAVDIRFNALMAFTNYRDAKDITFPPPTKSLQDLESEMHNILEKNGTKPIPPDVWEMIQKGELFLMLYGTVLYKGEGSSEEYFVKYCLRYDLQTDGVEVVLHEYD